MSFKEEKTARFGSLIFLDRSCFFRQFPSAKFNLQCNHGEPSICKKKSIIMERVFGPLELKQLVFLLQLAYFTCFSFYGAMS